MQLVLSCFPRLVQPGALKIKFLLEKPVFFLSVFSHPS